MKAIVKLFILLFVLVNITKAQVVLPMGMGQENSLNITCSYDDKMWVVSNEDEKFIVNKWDGNFWIQYNEIPIELLNTISTLPQSIEAKAIYYYNDELYLALANKYNEKLLLIKTSGKKWEAINTDNIKVSKNLTFLTTKEGLLLCGKITVGVELVTILKINQTDCEIYAGLSANHGANDYYTDFEYSDSAIWAIGSFDQGSFYFARLDKDKNWIVVSEPAFTNGNRAIRKYNEKLVMFGLDMDGTLSFAIQLANNKWGERTNGLTDWKINSVSDLREINGKLWVAGQFTNVNTNRTASLAFWDGSVWTVPNFDYLGNDLILNGTRQVLISGAFVTYQNLLLNHTGILDFGNAIIAGKVFNDLNANCTQEFGENNLEGIMLKLTLPTTEILYLTTDYNGRYYFPIDTTRKKIHLVELITPKYKEATCGSIKPAIITSRLTIPGIDFGIISNGTHADAGVQINDYTGWRARQGFDETYQICIDNKGTQKIESAKLTLKADSRLTNFTFTEQPIQWQNNVGEWNIKSLEIAEKYCFKVTATIPLSIPLESYIQFEVNLETTNLKDEDLFNNSKILIQKIVAAIDPNDKTTKQDYYIPSSQKVMDYQIRFQNTGNDFARNITVSDSIDPNLYIGLQGTKTEVSHLGALVKTAPIVWRQANGKWAYKYSWRFINIYLPDNKTNEQASNGFINFHMNLSASSQLNVGTIIKNRAYIYFDFQEPILTNIAKNKVRDDVGIKNHGRLNQFGIYPNPASAYIHITNPLKSSVKVNIINCLGQTILTKTISAETKLSISTTSMAKGIYLIQAEGFEPVKILVN